MMKGQGKQFLRKIFGQIRKASIFFFFFGIASPILFAHGIDLNEKTYVKKFYNNGNLKAEGWIVDSKKDGYWKFYYRNGQIEKEGHLSEDKRIKYWYFYHDNGMLKSEGHYDNGSKTKWWLFYDSTEMVNHKCQLKNGQKNGYCLIYRNDEIVKASKFEDGKKIKEWTDFKSFRKDNKLSDLQ